MYCTHYIPSVLICNCTINKDYYYYYKDLITIDIILLNLYRCFFGGGVEQISLGANVGTL